ncbi:MAG: hypothetical protein Q9163_001122 [Psora crenata]
MASTTVPPTPCASSHSKRARRVPDHEWDIWREKLEQLFLENNLSRKDIVDIMVNEHSFVVTEVQLKRRFEKWGVKKYIPQDDLKIMLSMRRKRQRIGEDVRFQWRGRNVEQERIERASKRIKGPLMSPEYHATGGLSPLPDIDMPLPELEIASGIIDSEFNNRSDFHFDLPFIQEVSGANDPAPVGHTLNDFTMADAPALASEQSGFFGVVGLTTKALFEVPR